MRTAHSGRTRKLCQTSESREISYGHGSTNQAWPRPPSRATRFGSCEENAAYWSRAYSARASLRTGRLHGSGAGARRAGRSPRRPLERRPGAVRNGQGHAARAGRLDRAPSPRVSGKNSMRPPVCRSRLRKASGSGRSMRKPARTFSQRCTRLDSSSGPRTSAIIARRPYSMQRALHSSIE